MRVFIISFSLFLASCASSLSGINNSATKASPTLNASSKMIAVNHILPSKKEEFELLNQTVILPAFKKYNSKVYNGLHFWIPNEENKDGTFTFIYIASPYYPEMNYDIFQVLLRQYNRQKAEEYFEQWMECFAYEQEVISFE